MKTATIFNFWFVALCAIAIYNVIFHNLKVAISIIFVVLGFVIATMTYCSLSVDYLYSYDEYISNIVIKTLEKVINLSFETSSNIRLQPSTWRRQLDAEIEHILLLLFRDYLFSWHDHLCKEAYFTHELYRDICDIVQKLITRVSDANWVSFFIKVLDGFVNHYKLYVNAHIRLSHRREPVYDYNQKPLVYEFFVIEKELYLLRHQSICLNSEAEMKHLYFLSECILYILLSEKDFENIVVRYCARDLIANSVLLPILNCLSDPDFINRQISTNIQKTKNIYTPDQFIRSINLSPSVEEIKMVRKSMEDEIIAICSSDLQTGVTAEYLENIKKQISSLNAAKSMCDLRIDALENFYNQCKKKLILRQRTMGMPAFSKSEQLISSSINGISRHSSLLDSNSVKFSQSSVTFPTTGLNQNFNPNTASTTFSDPNDKEILEGTSIRLSLYHILKNHGCVMYLEKFTRNDPPFQDKLYLCILAMTFYDQMEPLVNLYKNKSPDLIKSDEWFMNVKNHFNQLANRIISLYPNSVDMCLLDAANTEMTSIPPNLTTFGKLVKFLIEDVEKPEFMEKFYASSEYQDLLRDLNYDNNTPDNVTPDDPFTPNDQQGKPMITGNRESILMKSAGHNRSLSLQAQQMPVDVSKIAPDVNGLLHIIVGSPRFIQSNKSRMYYLLKAQAFNNTSKFKPVFRQYSDILVLNQIIKYKYSHYLINVTFPELPLNKQNDAGTLESVREQIQTYFNKLTSPDILNQSDEFMGVLIEFLSASKWNRSDILKALKYLNIPSHAINLHPQSHSGIFSNLTHRRTQSIDTGEKSSQFNRLKAFAVNLRGNNSSSINSAQSFDPNSVSVPVKENPPLVSSISYSNSTLQNLYENEDSSSTSTRSESAIPKNASLCSTNSRATQEAPAYDQDAEFTNVFIRLINELFSRGNFRDRISCSVIKHVLTNDHGESNGQKIIETVKDYISSEAIHQYLIAFRTAWWPDDVLSDPSPPRSESIKYLQRCVARSKFISILPNTLKTLFGDDHVMTASEKIFSMLQYPELNRRFLYVIIEGLLECLFPDSNFDEIFRKILV